MNKKKEKEMMHLILPIKIFVHLLYIFEIKFKIILWISFFSFKYFFCFKISAFYSLIVFQFSLYLYLSQFFLNHENSENWCCFQIKIVSSVIEMETFFSHIINFFHPKIFLSYSTQFNILTRVVSYCKCISEEAMKKKDVMISSELIDLIGAKRSGLEIVIWSSSWSWSWRLC